MILLEGVLQHVPSSPAAAANLVRSWRVFMMVRDIMVDDDSIYKMEVIGNKGDIYYSSTSGSVSQ
jgi:hypothetical protein